MSVSSTSGRRSSRSVRCPSCHARAGERCKRAGVAGVHPARRERASTHKAREVAMYEHAKALALADGVPEFLTGPDGDEPWWVPVKPPVLSGQMLLAGVPGPTVEGPERAVGVIADYLGRDPVAVTARLRPVFMRVDLEAIREAVAEGVDDYDDEDWESGPPLVSTWEEGWSWCPCEASDRGAVAFWQLEGSG